MEICEVSCDVIFDDPSFEKAAEEYARESANPFIGLTANPNRQGYSVLENSGMFRVCAAYEDNKLVGFVTVLASPHFHYGVLVASIETLWLHQEHRKGPAGLRLIREARRIALDMGAVALYASAPAASRLAKLLDRIATKTDEVFFFHLKD